MTDQKDTFREAVEVLRDDLRKRAEILWNAGDHVARAGNGARSQGMTEAADRLTAILDAHPDQERNERLRAEGKYPADANPAPSDQEGERCSTCGKDWEYGDPLREFEVRIPCSDPFHRIEDEAYNQLLHAHVRASEERDTALDRERTLREALERIAVGRRPDGTYNLSREACQELARAALESTTEET